LVVANNDYQTEQAAAAKHAAQDSAVDLEIIQTEHDPIGQSQEIFKLLYYPPEKRPNGILFEPVGTPIVKAAELAASSGVGWVVLNREVDYLNDLRRRYSTPLFSVTTDHDKVGRIQGEQISALLPKGGTIFYIQGPSDNKAALRRATAMQLAKPSNVELRTLKGLWTEESVFAAVSSWLKLNVTKQHPFAAVVAQNDAMALGARRAFDERTANSEREHWLSLPFLGCDGLPSSGQLYVNRNILTATIVIPANAGHAVKTLANALRASQQPPECIFMDAHSYPEISKLKPR
jgi:ribose transport system substrate-binding protein